MKEYEQFNQSQIVDYLKKCDRELLDTLASHYDSSKTYNEGKLSTKRMFLANTISSNEDHEIADKLKEYCEEVAQLQQELEELKREAQKFKEAYKEKEEKVKEVKETIAATKIAKKQTFQKDLLTEEQLVKVQDKYEELEQIKQAERARKIREKQKEKALIEYAKGVALAVLDKEEAEYIETANNLANRTIELTKKYCEEAKIENIPSCSQLVAFNAGMEELIKPQINPIMESAKQAIKSRAKSNSKTKQKQTVKASR